MKHILLILFTALSFSAIGQTVPMTNNVPWYEYSKKLSVGKFMLKSSGEYDTSFTIPSNTASITLDTIAADKTVTFADGASTDRGVTMWIQNSNNSAFIWNVAGNVKEADGTVISNLPRGLHIFYWNSNAWIRLSTSGGSSPTVDTLTFSSPLVQLDKNVSLDYDAFPQDTAFVEVTNDSMFNKLYSHTGIRDSTLITRLDYITPDTIISGSLSTYWYYGGVAGLASSQEAATINRPTLVTDVTFLRWNEDSSRFEAGDLANGWRGIAFTDELGSGGGGSGTVTNVATGYGLSGGPITTTGTILADTSNQLASKLRLYKVADSLGALIGVGSVDTSIISTKINVTNQSQWPVRESEITPVAADNRRNDAGSAIVKGDTLFVAYTAFGASTGDADSARINLKYSLDKGMTWSTQSTAVAPSGTGVYNPSMYLNGAGEIVMLYLRKNTSTTGQIYKTVRTGGTWSTPASIYGDGTGYYAPSADRIFKTKQGRLLYPFNVNTNGTLTSATGNYRGFMLTSVDDGTTWTHAATINIGSPDSLCAEPGVFQVDNLTAPVYYYYRTRSGDVYYTQADSTGISAPNSQYPMGIFAQNSASSMP